MPTGIRSPERGENKHRNITFFLLGATGNLAELKLNASLAEVRDGAAPDELKLVGVALENLTAEQYRRRLAERSGVNFPDAEYVGLDFEKEGLERLLPYGAEADEIYLYLAVSPRLSTPLLRKIAACPWPDRSKLRLLLEKPYGLDYADTAAANRLLREQFDESQIYRIDHYLGKDGVQELLDCRQQNKAVWNGDHISQIDLLIAEAVGIEDRLGFYSQTGAVADVAQSHLLQMLVLTVMEGDAARRGRRLETVRGILRSLERGGGSFYCGQYLEFPTETLVAGQFRLELPGWEGVLVRLLTGKRMTEKQSQVRVYFKDRPEPAVLDFKHREGISDYARLIGDALAGKRDFFLSPEEAEATWLFGACIKKLLPDGGKPEGYLPDTVTAEQALAKIK